MNVLAHTSDPGGDCGPSTDQMNSRFEGTPGPMIYILFTAVVLFMVRKVVNRVRRVFA